MQEISQLRLRYFNEVLACGSMRGAADKLNTAASVVSRQIQLLEKEIGTLLFERRSRGLIPTEAAQMLLEYHRGCRAQHEHLTSRLQELRGMRRGRVHVVASEGFIANLMACVVGPFCMEYPELDVHVQRASVDEVVEAVVSDQAHIGLAYNPPANPALRCRTSQRHPVCLLVGKRHPLARKRAGVTLEEAMRYPFALMTAPYGLRQLVDILEFNERIHIAPSMTTNSVAALKHFVLSGAGVTFMPAIGTKGEFEQAGLVALPIAHPVLSLPECKLLVRLGRPLSAAVNEMLRRIELRLPQFQG